MTSNAKVSPTQPRLLKDVPQWDIDTEIAIVGFGGAGACAAIEAADNGASVSIFELGSDSGGSTIMSSAEIYMGGNGGTPPQKACGYEDSSEDMFNFLMQTQGPQASEEKTRTYVDGSLDHYDWLTSLGVPFRMTEYTKTRRAIMATTDDCLLYTGSEKAWPFKQHAKPCPRGHNLHVEGDNGGPELFKHLNASVASRNIDVHFEARALGLVVDEYNRVHGLVVRIDQKEVHVKASKGVILCAGGFVMNKDMLQKHAPKLANGVFEVGNPGDTGSGIQMGMSVGGTAINMHEGFISIPFYPPDVLTYGIFVNEQGQRFVNEDTYHGRVGSIAMQQLGRRLYLIANVEEMEQYDKGNYLGAPYAGVAEESLAELETELDLPEGSLEACIGLYNRHAEHGKDPVFHKADEWVKPLTLPLAALDVTPGHGVGIPYFTLGGLDTKITGEVLTAEGHVVEGLYAAGRTTCGMVRRGDGYASGMSVGDVTFFGRKAGRAAATAS